MKINWVCRTSQCFWVGYNKSLQLLKQIKANILFYKNQLYYFCNVLQRFRHNSDIWIRIRWDTFHLYPGPCQEAKMDKKNRWKTLDPFYFSSWIWIRIRIKMIWIHILGHYKSILGSTAGLTRFRGGLKPFCLWV